MSFRDLLEFGFRQAYRGRRIRRDLDGYGQLAVRDFPAGRHAAVQALDRSVREGQPTARLRLNQNMFVTGVALVELNACNDAVDPFADCAVGVVVEGIHPRILKTAVGLDAVPSFPDRRGAFGDRIKPGRILGTIQQHVGEVEITVIAQNLAQQRCSQESRGEMAEFLNIVGKPGRGARALRFRQQVKRECQRISCLRIRRKPAIGRHKFFLKRAHDFCF